MPSDRSTSSSRAQLALQDVTKRYDGRAVLERVSLTVRPGERAGVIGDNGSGKSTLLRLVAGRERPDGGDVTVHAPGGTGYLPQRLELPDAGTVGDVVETAFADLRALEARIHDAEASLGDADRRGLDAYGEMLAEFEARGGYRVDARVDAALHGLGLPALDRARPLATLSGGERSRLALAVTLAADPELLLLDEPTNDLDDTAVDWLEKRLRGHRGTVVAVTHDRAFLDAVTDTILEVDADRRTVVRHGDGYQGYLRAKATARRAWERAYADHLAQVARQEALAEQAGTMLASISRKGPRAFGGGYHRSRSSSLATSHRVRNARERLRRLEADPVPKPPEPLRFRATLATGAAGDLLAAAASGPDGEEEPLTALSRISVPGRLTLDELRLHLGQRLLVTGPNGAGKSTLLRVLAGELEPAEGRVRRAEHVGFLRQDVHPRHPRRTVLAEFADGRPGHPDEHADELLDLGLFRRRELASRLEELSVGQRRRVELARLVTRPADLLLLDEPTNHLSPLLVEELEAALTDYPGTVVLVTHDRRIRRAFTGIRLHLHDGRRAGPAAPAP